MKLGNYPVLDQEDAHFCDSAFDWLDQALNLDPYGRFTAGELLEHPFLNHNGKQ